MSVCVLWDDAHIWGLLVARALAHFRCPARLVNAADVAQGILSRKPCRLLLVPGGNARRKASALGVDGCRAVREFVASGGAYLGLCGGAGLALTGGGLDLVPWRRRPFDSRLQHFVSGHMHLSPTPGDPLVPPEFSAAPLAPVWWPGQFEIVGDEVRVVASYADPGPDLCIADLPLASLPAAILADWEALYGLTLPPTFMAGRPCLARGGWGQGQVVLSYAHLETPASALANRWLAHILGRLAGVDGPAAATVPEWQLRHTEVVWTNSVLTTAARGLEELVALGQEHHLLYWRTPWLLGWRRGLPGLAINSLLALVATARSRVPDAATRQWWRERSRDFAQDFGLFHRAAGAYLLAERLDMTLSHAPDAVELVGLSEQRRALFGPAPGSGGLAAALQSPLEELVRRQLDAKDW